jgi:DNA-binding transcriptional ArsR family regulator
MDEIEAIAALAALAQPTRLATFRRLIAAAPEGIAAGELARLAATPQNTMSAHLAVLARAGLVVAAREGRVQRYRAELAAMRALLTYLAADCCGGHPEVCVSPLLLSPCHQPEPASHV